MIERLANAEAHILHAQKILANYESETCNNVGIQCMEQLQVRLRRLTLNVRTLMAKSKKVSDMSA